MKNIAIVFLLGIIGFNVNAQNWTLITDPLPEKGIRDIVPAKYIVANVSDEAIKAILWSAPHESKSSVGASNAILEVLLANNTLEQFKIIEYDMMEAGLAAKYPNIKTFYGKGVNNPLNTIRLDYTVHGFRAVVSEGPLKTYIDHYQRNDKDHKVIYYKSDFNDRDQWECLFETPKLKEEKKKGSTRQGDCVFRSYRMSITATGEYSNFHGADDASESGMVQSAVTTTLNRVNEMFEMDVTVRFLLIGNNDLIYYYDPATDPFSGSNANSMINQNQTNTDAVIGSGNYDIGHIFSTGGSGLAGLGVICVNGSKAKGVTGISNPVGDPFDIDYVSHEIGHQLGGNHTQNNSCNRNNATAMEPGSASTIMGYAGICNPNVQGNSDAYFHAISMQEMNQEVGNNSCHGVITLANSQPTVDALTDKTIPHSTPFVLDCVANDADGDVLMYNWEQMDNEVGSMPPSGTNTVGPMFRSLFATTDSKRYFPSIDNVIDGTTDTWEVLPTVGRDMDFRITVRDNTNAPGCHEETDITITTAAGSGPFEVTSQNVATTWQETQNVTITWDVSNTDVAPVNTDEVDIYLSYDGGNTYPATLLENTPNDGSQTVVVPLGTTTEGRVMVKGSENVFYDINDADITIDVGAPSYTIAANPASADICNQDGSTTFVLESTSLLGYTDPITLTVIDLPPGATSSIATNPILPGNNTNITIGNLTNLSGNFSIKILGTSNGIDREATFDLSLFPPNNPPSLISPDNGATGLSLTPELEWTAITGSTYEYEISLGSNGSNLVVSGSTASSQIVVSPPLSTSTTYYWRVRNVNECGPSDWSDERTFETALCINYLATEGFPINISSSGTPTIVSSFDVKDKGVISDLDIINLNGDHTWMADLNFTLISPDNAELEFWTDPCGSNDDFDINFDDEATSANFPCPPTDGGFHQAEEDLSFFDSKQIYGNWQLEVFDDYNQDGGALDGWGVGICLSSFCDLTVNNNSFIDVYGTLLKALNCAVDGDTIYLESAIANSTIDMGNLAITIATDVVIIADPQDNISISSESSFPMFTIATGTNVVFSGVSIQNIDSEIGVIRNFGNLTLKDVDITFIQDGIPIVNNDTGQMTLDGNCNFVEE